MGNQFTITTDPVNGTDLICEMAPNHTLALTSRIHSLPPLERKSGAKKERIVKMLRQRTNAPPLKSAFAPILIQFITKRHQVPPPSARSSRIAARTLPLFPSFAPLCLSPASDHPQHIQNTINNHHRHHHHHRQQQQQTKQEDAIPFRFPMGPI